MFKEVLLAAGLVVGAANVATASQFAAPDQDNIETAAKVVIQDVLADTHASAINCGCGGGNCSC